MAMLLVEAMQLSEVVSQPTHMTNKIRHLYAITSVTISQNLIINDLFER